MLKFDCDFERWNIALDAEVSRVQQYDNKTIDLSFAGDFPAEYTKWSVYLKFGNWMDIITLEASEDGYHVVLTADQLSFRGTYDVQIYGENGDKKRHTNIATFVNPVSLSGDALWPELPKKFSDALNKVESAVVHSPVIDLSTLHWMVWDFANEEYVDTGISASGGNVMSVNGKTGAVVLNAEDVGALPDDTSIPTKTSELENDSGFLTEHQSLAGKQDKITASGLLKGDGDGGVSAAEPGVDYLTEHQSLAAYQTKTIEDAGGYFPENTVEAALQYLGSEFNGANAALNDLLNQIGGA